MKLQLAETTGTAAAGLHSEICSELAAGAQTATFTVHRILYGYAAVLGACSGAQFSLHVAHATFFAAMAAITLATGCAANVGTGTPPVKGEAGYVRWMVGVHLGLVLPPLWALVTAYHLAFHAASDTAFAWIVLGVSVLVLVAIVKLKPRRQANAKGLV
jgi:hypothetical protein